MGIIQYVKNNKLKIISITIQLAVLVCIVYFFLPKDKFIYPQDYKISPIEDATTSVPSLDLISKDLDVPDWLRNITFSVLTDLINNSTTTEELSYNTDILKAHLLIVRNTQKLLGYYESKNPNFWVKKAIVGSVDNSIVNTDKNLVSPTDETINYLTKEKNWPEITAGQTVLYGEIIDDYEYGNASSSCVHQNDANLSCLSSLQKTLTEDTGLIKLPMSLINLMVAELAIEKNDSININSKVYSFYFYQQTAERIMGHSATTVEVKGLQNQYLTNRISDEANGKIQCCDLPKD